MKRNYDRYKHCVGRSEVVPNQALSLREIMNRSLKGQRLMEVTMNQLQYGEDDREDPELPEFEDKFDVLDHANYLEQRVAEYKAAIEAEKALKQANAPKPEQSEGAGAEAQNLA